LILAAEHFDVLFTIDKNICHPYTTNYSLTKKVCTQLGWSKRFARSPRSVSAFNGASRKGIARRKKRSLRRAVSFGRYSQSVEIYIDKSQSNRSISAIELIWGSGLGAHPRNPHA
jgi:hypothetical protein